MSLWKLHKTLDITPFLLHVKEKITQITRTIFTNFITLLCNFKQENY